MYMIAKGECIVNIRDENNKMIKKFKVLVTSDYFGEISMIYGCRRTATITSKKYTTLAMLPRAKFKDIQTEFPEMPEVLKQGIYMYADRAKRFMSATIKKIDFFRGIGEDSLHDLLFSMELLHFNTGEILQKPGEKINTLWIIVDGCIEVTTEFDDHKFKLARLYRGSAINYRMWVMDDNSHVFLSCQGNVVIYKLTLDKMTELTKRHKELEEKFLKF
jgi:CRP-like cAMP-binding protein